MRLIFPFLRYCSLISAYILLAKQNEKGKYFIVLIVKMEHPYKTSTEKWIISAWIWNANNENNMNENQYNGERGDSLILASLAQIDFQFPILVFSLHFNVFYSYFAC